MPESDRRHVWLVRVLIVLLVFSVLFLTLMQPWKLVLYGLAWLLPADKPWAEWVGWSAAIAGVLLALVGALWICRRMWPTTSKSHA